MVSLFPFNDGIVHAVCAYVAVHSGESPHHVPQKHALVMMPLTSVVYPYIGQLCHTTPIPHPLIEILLVHIVDMRNMCPNVLLL